MTSALRSRWPLEWRRRGCISSGCLKKTQIGPISWSNFSKITNASFFETPLFVHFLAQKMQARVSIMFLGMGFILLDLFKSSQERGN